MRRLALHLEDSLSQGPSWVVMEPNGPALWTHVRAVTEDYLATLFRAGALAGRKPEEAVSSAAARRR